MRGEKSQHVQTGGLFSNIIDHPQKYWKELHCAHAFRIIYAIIVPGCVFALIQKHKSKELHAHCAYTAPTKKAVAKLASISSYTIYSIPQCSLWKIIKVRINPKVTGIPLYSLETIQYLKFVLKFHDAFKSCSSTTTFHPAWSKLSLKRQDSFLNVNNLLTGMGGGVAT